MQKPTHREWLGIAKQDLEAAKLLADQEEVFGAAFFLTQQSAEKALKGFLVFKGKELRRTHDLTLLLSACAELDESFFKLAMHAAELQGYITSTRYPDDAWYLPDKGALLDAILMAEKIFFAVQEKIKE